VPPSPGFAAVVHTGSDWLGFAAGMGAGACWPRIFGVLVIWLNTNQYATGLALSLFGAGFSAFAGIGYVQASCPSARSFHPAAGRHSAWGRRCSASTPWSTSPWRWRA
jgi:ABC-type uncharacterized transport system permease subunit